MANDALYLAPDGEVKLFDSESLYVVEPFLPEPYPGDTWEHDPLTGIRLPHLTISERRYTRIKIENPEFEAAIRRLLTEREEARGLVALASSAAPALCGGAEWPVWDAVKKALRRWGL